MVRTNSDGGGILTAVHHALEPVSVFEDSEVELMTVEVSIKGRKVRLINGYGPQENLSEEVRKSFFNSLDIEVKRARTAGAMICIQMDSNAKLGSSYIANDHKTSIW